MLTGLELAAWERAGYFVRRNTLPAAAIGSMRGISADLRAADARRCLSEVLAGVPALVELLIDLMGPDLTLLSAAMASKPSEHGYVRNTGPALDAPALQQLSRLAGEATGLVLCAAATDAEWLDVLPGTHVQPPAPEQLAPLRQGATPISGSVRVRLAGGDVLLRDTRLAHRCANPVGLWARYEFAAPLPGAPDSPPIEQDETLPQAVRQAFRRARQRMGR